MKARVPRISANEKKKLKSEIKLEVERIWNEVEQEKETDITRRVLKTMIYVLIPSTATESSELQGCLTALQKCLKNPTKTKSIGNISTES